MESDSTRWGLAILVLALVVATLDWISSTAPQATLVVVCLLVAGSSLMLRGALAMRRSDRDVRSPAP